MAENWHDIALCDGSPETGQLGFNLNLEIPEAISEIDASERQKEAVRLFYQIEPESLRDCQAHTLLCCREYARLCCDMIFGKYPQSVRRLIAPCLGAFVLSDPRMTQFAVIWSERNFERGTGSPRVRGTPNFSDVEQFAAYLEGCMEMNGWTLDRLKAAELR